MSTNKIDKQNEKIAIAYRIAEIINKMKAAKEIAKQKDFCEKAGIVSGVLSQAKRGSRPIPSYYFPKIHEAFPNVNIDYLLTGEGTPFCNTYTDPDFPEDFTPDEIFPEENMSDDIKTLQNEIKALKKKLEDKDIIIINLSNTIAKLTNN